MQSLSGWCDLAGCVPQATTRSIGLHTRFRSSKGKNRCHMNSVRWRGNENVLVHGHTGPAQHREPSRHGRRGSPSLAWPWQRTHSPPEPLST